MAKEDTEKSVLKFAYSIIAEAKRIQEGCGVKERYRKSIRYQKGDQPATFSKEKYNRKWNKYAEIFENRIAHITSKRVKWKYRPQGDDDIITADVLNQVLGDVLYEKDDWDEKSEGSMIEAAHAGSVHIKTIYNDDLNGWPTFKVIECESVLCDNRTPPRFIVHIFRSNVETIKRVYGKSVAADPQLEKIDEKGSFDSPMISFESAGDYKMPSAVWGDTSYGDTFDKSPWMSSVIGDAVVAELWIEDNTMEKVPYSPAEVEAEHETLKALQKVHAQPEQNHPEHIKAHEAYLKTLDPQLDSNQIRLLNDLIEEHEAYPQKEKQRKYPNGRIITVCQNKLLDDRPNKLKLHWRDLWVKYDYIKVPGSYWGKNLGNDLFDIQDAINHRKNSISQNIDMLNNGIKKVNVRAFKNLRDMKKAFSNMIANIFPVRNKDDVIVDFGPPLPPQYFQDLYHDEAFMDKQAGESELLRGDLPGSDTAGITVSQLMGPAMQRINFAARHYALAMQKIARNAMMIMKYHMPGDQVFRILGNNGLYANITWEQIRDHINLEDIRVDVEALQATSRMEKLQMAIQLYNGGIYDRQAVLEALDDPKAPIILQRVSEIEILKQKTQQLEEFNDKILNENERLNQNIRGMQEKAYEQRASETKKEKK